MSAAVLPDGREAMRKNARAKFVAKYGPIPDIRLGSMIELLAKPMAQLMKLPCLDEKGQLRPESGCAKRRDRMNNITA